MSGRDPAEAHRSATPLELLFDLAFVVAVAQAASFLHHDLAEGQFAHGVSSYLVVFFTISAVFSMGILVSLLLAINIATIARMPA